MKDCETKNFKNGTSDKLRCHCDHCQGNKPSYLNIDALKALQRVRDRFNKPMSINSAYRCRQHPAEARKEKPGKHNIGTAFDISVPWGRDRMELIDLLIDEGFDAFGFGDTFLHADYKRGYFTSWTYN